MMTGGVADEMRRIVCTDLVDPARLEVRSEPTPAPGPGEVLMEVEASGVSFVDNLIAKGHYQLKPPLPFTPGSSAAGRVVAAGAGVDPARVGQRVATLRTAFGTFASHLVLPADAAVPLPDAVPAAVAATAIENYGTMLFAVRHRVSVPPGSRVVVLGAGGGIGLAAVDVLHGLGARVVAVASSAGKRAAALAAGAETAIPYDDLKDAIRAATDGGADVVVDPVGGAASETALRALRVGGTLCVLGFASGEIPRLPANIVLLRNRAVVGVDWGDWARADPAAATALVADVMAEAAANRIHPPQPQVLPLDEAATAFARFDRREVTGKIALLP
jgi:NADPH:quinone reductase